jgi:hypothetical protein
MQLWWKQGVSEKVSRERWWETFRKPVIKSEWSCAFPGVNASYNPRDYQQEKNHTTNREQSLVLASQPNANVKTGRFAAEKDPPQHAVIASRGRIRSRDVDGLM